MHRQLLKHFNLPGDLEFLNDVYVTLIVKKYRLLDSRT